MTIEEMLLEIEQTSKYGTPLLTHHAVAILTKLREAEELANYCNYLRKRFWAQGLKDEQFELAHFVEAYERAGDDK